MVTPGGEILEGVYVADSEDRLRRDIQQRVAARLAPDDGRIAPQVEEQDHLPAVLQRLMDRLVQCAADGGQPPLKLRIFASVDDPHRLEPGPVLARRLEAAHALCGRFTIGATVAGSGPGPDGAESATLRWHGERGDLPRTRRQTLSAAHVFVCEPALSERPVPPSATPTSTRRSRKFKISGAAAEFFENGVNRICFGEKFSFVFVKFEFRFR